MKKMLLFGLLAILVLVAYGCQTVQTIPKPIEQIPVQNQTLTPSSLCSPSETFIPDFLGGYGCQPTSVIKACEAAGGNWRLFGDGCGDSCGEKPRMCTLALQAACDCGLSKCWGTAPPCKIDPISGAQVCRVTLEVVSPSCISDFYEPYTTPAEACKATNGTWTSSIREQTCCKSFDEASGSAKYFWSADARCGAREGVSCTGSCASPTDANLCPSRTTLVASNICLCPLGLTFGLQGCKEYPLKTNELMSIVGGWQ